MSILKEAGDSFLKYSEIIVSKTSDYTRIAKLNIDIKRIEMEIDRTEKELGAFVLGKIESGASSIDATDQALKYICDKIKKHKSDIDSKKNEIEALKKKDSSGPNA